MNQKKPQSLRVFDDNEDYPLSDTKFESKSIIGTDLWDVVFNPDHDVTTIRTNGFIIKVKNYFIRENSDCTVFLYNDRIFVKVTVTNGRIDEYESIPARKCEGEDYAPIAWIYRNNRYENLKHKRVREG